LSILLFIFFAIVKLKKKTNYASSFFSRGGEGEIIIVEVPSFNNDDNRTMLYSESSS